MITNWSGSVRFSPHQSTQPVSEEDVVTLVKQARKLGSSIRVMGSGHSFTPLIETDAILVSFDQLQGLDDVDANKRLSSVWAGTKLKALGELLFQKGCSLENLGDINTQSIAGAVSTGTHGTGTRFGNLSDQLESITLVTADGKIRTCSREKDEELFHATRVSLGSLGLITRMQMRVEPCYRLHYKSQRLPLQTVLDRLEEFKTKNRHFEFFWFPYTETTQCKFMNKTNLPPTKRNGWSAFNKWVLENGAFWCLSEVARQIPRFSRWVSQISAKGVPQFEEVGESHALFTTPRLVRFNEMEYSIPAEALPSVIEEICRLFHKRPFYVHFPIEVRFVKRDDIWLSPAYQRNSAFIAIHMYKGMPYQEYFHAMEQIFLQYDGRPHWGKTHSLEVEELRRRYPRWDDFQRIRQQLDPDGMFLNPYLKRLFGK
ncbi:D-arabinono-1,4-lactone oxidase [Melghirimyces algeriensis]|uniref:FAD-linked oxidoreductase n=1 Tax=Melghirimyces algeriensis TaxID=910412 RepID=A0A521AWV5_9BACL|nr:D-arabinono-1,4-lactone oxidase [Melghirimyces algeriensis]SMO39254.1 FAD-linked oxidoreductase [Melghirimyces algeriensis]